MPGSIAATPVESPVDIEEGLPLEVRSCAHMFQHLTAPVPWSAPMAALAMRARHVCTGCLGAVTAGTGVSEKPGWQASQDASHGRLPASC